MNRICQVNLPQSNIVLEYFTPILGIVRTFQDNIVQKYGDIIINKEIIYFGHLTLQVFIVSRCSIQQGPLNFIIGICHMTR